MANILVIHGPNLNLLGTREPGLYGKLSLHDINDNLKKLAQEYKHQLTILQSNAEHEIVTAIQKTLTDNIHFIIINPAAYTHTSIAIRDAFLAVNKPFIEVHLSNVFARESFRHHSYLSDVAHGLICGLGPQVYELAMIAANTYLTAGQNKL